VASAQIGATTNIGATVTNMDAIAFDSSGKLWGATSGSGSLYTVNPATGAATLVHALVGASNSSLTYGVTGLAFQPGTGILYASTSPDSPNSGDGLATINPATGQVTVIGPTGSGYPYTDIAFAPDGTLYGWQISAEGPTASAATINLATGAGTSLGDPQTNYTVPWVGLGIDSSGVIFVAANGHAGGVCDPTVSCSGALWTINSATGAPTQVGTITGGPGLSPSIAALAFSPGGVLYGIEGGDGGVGWNLVTISLTPAASGPGTTTYMYTGAPFDLCNGVASVNGNCPANFTSDYTTATFTFSAPLAPNLSSANELSSRNLISWSLRDALGNASYSSADANAATELTQLTLSTDSNGNIVAWQIQGPVFAAGSGVAYFGMNSPTVIGQGSGLPEADSFVNTAVTGYALGNSIPGHWTAEPLSMNVDVSSFLDCGYSTPGFPANSWTIGGPPLYSAMLAILTKAADRCSPKIFEAVATGQHFASAAITESQAGVADTFWTLTEGYVYSYFLLWSFSTPGPVETVELVARELQTHSHVSPPLPAVGAAAVPGGASSATLEISGICPSSNPSSWEFSVSGVLGSLNLVKPVDSCSQGLAQAHTARTRLSSAKLITQTSSGVKMELILTNVTVVVDRTSGDSESISLNFQTIEIEVNGVSASWDNLTHQV
jgi:type VI protein secretion system component Hcp